MDKRYRVCQYTYIIRYLEYNASRVSHNFQHIFFILKYKTGKYYRWRVYGISR